jgi:4-hydroxybenzoate polyprenyl transferase
MKNKLSPYFRLMRFHQLSGLWLLLWPGLIAIVITSKHILFDRLTIIFILGAILTRAAGCIINDIIDVEFDKKVARTMLRPLASDEITIRNALILLFILLFFALLLLLQLNQASVKLGVTSLILIILYPTMKRITFWPQIFLGITFNFSILIASVALTGVISAPAIFLYLGAIFWTLGYDTIYAYQDIKDDRLIGVKSTSMRFGDDGKRWISFFYMIFILMIIITAILSGVNNYFYLIFISVITHLCWQIAKFDPKDPKICHILFKSNIYLGAILLLAFVIGKL